MKVKVDNFNPTPRIDEHTLQVGRVIVLWFLWFLFAAFVLLFLVSRAHAQNTVAPFNTQQVNTSYYVGQSTLSTIQSAVTAACASSRGGRVTIQAGITPADTIGAVTGGCAKAPIIDQRSIPDACYTWNGSAYVAANCGGGGNPAGSDSDVQFRSGSGFGADSGNFTNNSTTHNLRQKQLNGIPYAGNYSTGANTGINNAFAALGGSGVIFDDAANTSDTTPWGAAQNSTIISVKNGGLGHRLHNCILNPILLPNDGVAGACESDILALDVTRSANGIGGDAFRATSTFTTGAGINNGNIGATDSGWAIDLGQWWQHNAFRDGISSVLSIEGKKNSLGDFQGIESRIWTAGGGNTDISGEGINNLALQGGQQGFYPFGTITSTTGTGDVTPTVSVNHPISSGTYMIDTQAATATGALAAAGSAPWAESTYLSTLATTAAVLTPSTADCVTLDDVHLPTVAGVPQPATFRCTVGALGAVTTGFAYLTSSGSLSEGITITSAPAPVSGVQTITALTSLAHFAGSNLIQGGTHGCMSFDANLSVNGWRSSYTVFGAKDSTHMIYGLLILGHVLGNTLPILGNEPETLSSPNNGFHIYPCAQVAYINPGSFGNAFHLRQNDVTWHNGDAIEFPPNPAVNMHSLFSDMTAVSPTSGFGGGSAFLLYHGPGVTGNYAPLSLRNNNPDSMYQFAGGWATAPQGVQIVGPHSVDFGIGEAPSQAVISIGSDHGVLYDLVESGGGTISIDPPNTRYVFTQNMLLGGALTVNSTASIGRGLDTGAFLQARNLLSDAKPPLTINEQFNNTVCRGIQFNNDATFTNTGRICSGHDFSNNWYMQLHAGWNDQLALQLWLDNSNVEHALFIGDIAAPAVTTQSASVLASTTTNDFAYFDNATGHIADSGVLKGSLVLLNAANQFGNFTQTFGLTSSGEVQISNSTIRGLDTTNTQTWQIDNATGTAVFPILKINQTFAGAGTSATTTSFSVKDAAGTTWFVHASTTP